MRLFYFTLVLALLSIGTTFGQTKTEKFKVYGKCSMCKTRIEKAAKSVVGVTTADWNVKTKMIEVALDTTKTSIKKVKEAIVEVGHDTNSYKAKDETYNALPSCCKYDRTPTNKEPMNKMDMKKK